MKAALYVEKSHVLRPKVKLVLFLCIVIINVIVYSPSLFHQPRSDQKLFYIETLNVESLPALIQKTYSYNRTRTFSPGDEILFRPLLFTVLSIEKWLFGYHFIYWQIMSIILHLLVIWALLRILLLIYESIWAYICALFFSVIYLSHEMVVFQHLLGYLLAFTFILTALFHLMKYVQSGQTEKKHMARMLIYLTPAIFLYEYASLVTVIFMVFLIIDRWRNLKKKEILGVLILGLPIVCYLAWDIYDFVSRQTRIHMMSELNFNFMGLIQVIYFSVKIFIQSWILPLVPYFMSFKAGPRLTIQPIDLTSVISAFSQQPLLVFINGALLVFVISATIFWYLRYRKSNRLYDSISWIGKVSLVLSLSYIVMIVLGRIHSRGEVYFISQIHHRYPIVLFNIIFMYSFITHVRIKSVPILSVKALLVVMLGVGSLNAIQTFQINMKIKKYFDQYKIEQSLGWSRYFQAQKLGAIGFLHHIHNEDDQALKYYNQALTVNPFDATAYNDRGVLHHQKYRFDLALVDYTQAMLINPFYKMPYNNRGTVYLLIGKYELALADFDKVLSLYPDFDEGYYNRGQVYEKLGRFEEAMNDYNKALINNPILVDAFVRRGNLLVKRQEYKKALKDYNKALKINPGLIDGYFNRALLYEIQNKFQLAILDYDKVIELRPRDERALCNRGVILSKLEQYTRALDDFNQSLQINPQYAPAYFNRSVLYGLQGNMKHAYEDAAMAQKLGYSLPDGYLESLQSSQ